MLYDIHFDAVCFTSETEAQMFGSCLAHHPCKDLTQNIASQIGQRTDWTDRSLQQHESE